MLKNKKGPMYSSAMNSEYDFVDYTNPNRANGMNEKDVTLFQSQILGDIQEEDFQYAEMKENIGFGGYQATSKFPQQEAPSVANTLKCLLDRTNIDNFQRLDMGREFECSYQVTEPLPSSRIHLFKGNEDYDFTSDELIQMMTDPYRSNMQSLKMRNQHAGITML